MRSIEKQWPLPKGIKEFIWNNTDYQTNKTQRVSRFVSNIEMYNGKPIKRIFGFLSRDQFRTKEGMMVKEVARYYNHKQYLGYVGCNMYSGNKIVYYDVHPDRFTEWKNEWTFYDDWEMTDPETFLEENNLPYTGWNEGKGWGLGFTEYLTQYLENPKVELLSKAGLGKWIRHIRYLDTTKKSLHEIFKIKPECVPLLKEPGFGLQELFICRKTGEKDYVRIMAITARDKVRKEYQRQYSQCFNKNNDIVRILDDKKTVEYCFRHRGSYTFCRDYIDYLRDLEKIGAISDTRLLYPEKLNDAHQEVLQQIRISESKELIEGFLKSYRKYKKYRYSNENYLIRPVKEPMELYSESDALHHCVRSYDKNVAKDTTEIMFIRKINEADVPFYTLELKNKKVIQVRGSHNCDPDDSIKAFVNAWAEKYKIKYSMKQPNYYY